MLAESPIGLAAAAAVANERIVVPGHFDVEVYGTFRRLFRQSKLTRGRFDAIVVRLARLAAERVGLSGLLLEAHVIADRVSATDAFSSHSLGRATWNFSPPMPTLCRALGVSHTYALSPRPSRSRHETWVAGRSP